MALPEEFLKEIESYGSPALSGLADALATAPSVAIRFNASKGECPPSGADCVPWCGQGCYLPQRPSFIFDPAMHQGRYYVQDASSMFLAHVVSCLAVDGSPVRYLDACAAPGGKTTAAISVLPAGSMVVANEYVAARAAVLRENLTKWGYPFVAVTQGDTAQFRTSRDAFDIVAADVPCSGEGMMRKDAEAVEQWSPALVAQCVARQREIIANLWPSLRPGGYFIYSTCTFNRTENEMMVQHIVDDYGAEPVAVDVDPAWGISGGIDTDVPCYRFIPGRINGEGLFMAVLRKPSCGDVSVPKPQKKRDRKGKADGKAAAVPAEVWQWVDCSDARFTVCGDRILLSPAVLHDGLPWMPVIEAAVVRGRDIVPSHALAMSTLMRRDAFAQVELTREQAIDYLRCEALSLPSGVARGIVLLTYGGAPLGFAKNLGNRANNLYPRQWRILQPRPSELPPLPTDMCR